MNADTEKPVTFVWCRGCGQPFRRGNESKEHKPDCIKCATCGHSVVEKVAGCDCCEWRR